MCELLSLSHIREAVETMTMIDVPGQFMSKSGKPGMRAILKECSHNKVHNFNLLKMSRLLHAQGWRIMHGYDSLNRIENKKGGVIEFDIVVPTSKGAMYACKFV